MIASLVSKLSQPWSIEYQIAIAVVSGVALGLLLAVGGRII